MASPGLPGTAFGTRSAQQALVPDSKAGKNTSQPPAARPSPEAGSGKPIANIPPSSAGSKHIPAKSRQIPLACSGNPSDECDHRSGRYGPGRNRMSIFTIDTDNNITAYASAQDASRGDAAGRIQFKSEATLATISTQWPMSRFVDIWNGIPGQTPVKKFSDRKRAVARIWSAIQPLAGTGQPSEPSATKPEPPPTAVSRPNSQRLPPKKPARRRAIRLPSAAIKRLRSSR